MLLTTIRQAVTDIYTSEVIPTSRLNRFIALAVNFYSRFNPLIDEYTFTTVLNDNNYPMPTYCIGIQKVLYPAITISSSSANYGSDFERMQHGVPYNQPSLHVVDDINEDAYILQYKGHYEYRVAQNQLVIDPTPGTGTSVKVVWYGRHVLNIGGTGYDTIPDEDLEIIAALVLVQILEARSIEASMEPDTMEGLQKIAVHFIPGTAQFTIDNMKQKLYDKYGSGTAVDTIPS